MEHGAAIIVSCSLDSHFRFASRYSLQNRFGRVGSEGLEPTTPAVFLHESRDSCCQSGVLTKLDDEPENVCGIILFHIRLNAFGNTACSLQSTEKTSVKRWTGGDLNP